MKFDENGNYLPDNTKVEVPLHLRRQVPSLQEQIRRFVRTEMSRQAEEVGEETFEEADDFDVDDDSDLPMSPHELTPMQEERRMPRDREGPDDRRDDVQSVGSKTVADGSVEPKVESNKAGGEGADSGGKGGAKAESGGA